MRLQRTLARSAVVSLGAVLALSGCALVGPPYAARRDQASRNERAGVIAQQPSAGAAASIPPSAAPSVEMAPGSSAAAASAPPHYRLGPAAQALVADARVQERSGNFGLATETLERAVSIEPRNPLVWLALSRESLAAGNAAQSYGMARKALYLASGDASAQASAWGQIAATLRAEGHNQAALAAEQKAAQLSVQ